MNTVHNTSLKGPKDKSAGISIGIQEPVKLKHLTLSPQIHLQGLSKDM